MTSKQKTLRSAISRGQVPVAWRQVCPTCPCSLRKKLDACASRLAGYTPSSDELVCSVAVPVVACVVLAVSSGGSAGWLLLSCSAAALLASVLAAVHHAEVIAHRVGEPFGTLVLALAVTVNALRRNVPGLSLSRAVAHRGRIVSPLLA